DDQVGRVFGASPNFDRGGLMARRIRFALSLVLVTFALSAAACADATGPRQLCDHNNPAICK
ncbi:MAG: hypothetical protein ACREMN_13615, partial [Gemmatimonadales bacterium]